MQTRGATTFATATGVEDSSSYAFLTVGSKRRLEFYEWRDSEFEGMTELMLPHSVKSLSLGRGATAFVGTTQSFYLVNFRTKQARALSIPGDEAAAVSSGGTLSYIGLGKAAPRPASVFLGEGLVHIEARTEGGRSLLTRDAFGVVVDDHGDSVEDVPKTSFADTPRGLALVYPYLLSIMPNCIEVRNPATLAPLTKIDVADVKSWTDGKLAYIATATKLWRLFANDYSKQIQELSTNMLPEAISLLETLDPALVPTKEEQLRSLQHSYAEVLFDKQKYADALLLFSEISAPPDQVLNLFPDELYDPSDAKQQSASDSLRSRVTSIDQQSAGEESASETPENKPDNKTIIRSLLPYLADTRRKIAALMTSSEQVKYRGFELNKDIYGDLTQAAKLVDTTLFRCYNVVSPSLMGPLVRVSNHCDPEVVTKVLSERRSWKDLVDFYYGKSMHREVLKLLKKLSDDRERGYEGPGATVQYLNRIYGDSDAELVFEFATWTIQEDEDNGDRIFIHPDAEGTVYPRHRVFRYLKELDPNKPRLTARYLEHIIDHMGDTTTTFHDNLALLYINFVSAGNRNTQELNPDSHKLLKFLRSSTHYRPDTILRSINASDPRLHEARALVYGRKGNHDLALDVFISDMHDPTLARQYCAELYDKDPEAGKTALHSLLTMHLKQNDTHDALQLLAQQGFRMSPEAVLSCLPDDISVMDISGFVQAQLRSLTGMLRTDRLDVALLSVHLQRSQEALLEYTQRQTSVDTYRTCKVCNKRLGNSVISIYPDNVVVHYGCAKKYERALESQKEKHLAGPFKKS